MITRDGDRYVLRGPVTMGNAVIILEQSKGLFEGDAVRVDLSGVTEVDSSAVSLLLQWLRDGIREKRRVVFCGVPKDIVSLADLYGVRELIPTDSSPA
jgi:phospholipid transport system transporter-binding protein